MRYLLLIFPMLIAWQRELPFPDETHSFPVLSTAITEVQSLGDKGLIEIPWRGKELILNNDWTLNKAHSVDVYAPMQRVDIQVKNESNWRGAVQVKDSLLLLSSDRLKITEIHINKESKFKWLAENSIAYDIIRPPADPQGEATPWEVAHFRKKFLAALEAADPETYIGFEQLPWPMPANQIGFLVASRIPEFPLLTMQCEKAVPSQCVLDRGCFVRDQSILRPEERSGLAYSKEQNLILVGDAEKNQIVAYRGSSCFNVHEVGTILLPKRLKAIMGIHIDSLGRLWISTKAQDDYNNSSVFMWEKW